MQLLYQQHEMDGQEPSIRKSISNSELFPELQ